MMKVDAHVHFWELNEGHSIWISNKIFGLQHDFTPNMLKPLCQEAGLDGVIVIQAAAAAKETEYMFRIAKEDDFIKGVIGWIDLEADTETLESEINRLKAIPKFRGIRAHPHREFDASWLVSEQVKNSYSTLARNDVPVDFLFNCTQLEPLCGVMADVPEMTSIVNHGGRPFVMTGQLEPWRSDMRRIANETGAYIKVSGLAERAGVEWQTDTLRPWVEAMLEDFGCSRLIFASNWPVMTLMSTYGHWWESINEIIEDAGVSSADRDLLFGGTAAKVYGLGA